VERFDLEGPDVLFGRDPSADLRVEHPSIAPRHARLLVRRGRLILAELGGLVAVGQARISAPTTLDEGETFRIGDVWITAWTSLEPSAVGRSVGGATVLEEIDPVFSGSRRYRADLAAGAAEVSILGAGFDAHEVERFCSASSKGGGAIETFEGRTAMIERSAPGIRLDRLIDAMRTGRVRPSIEVAVAIVRRLAERVTRFHDDVGPHAGLCPESVRLGMDGDVRLALPGPRPLDPRSRCASKSRRMGLEPSFADDAFAIRSIGRELGGEDVAKLLLPFAKARTRGAFREVVEGLPAASDRLEIDPSSGHVARVVRLLHPRPEHRLGFPRAN
jgi:hypothetical protein